MREILAAADLIPGDIIISTGAEVIGYPHSGAMGRTALPLDLGGVTVEVHVDSETPYSVLR